MRKAIFVFVFVFLSFGAANAQRNYLITHNSVGDVRLGMTVAEARRVLKGYTLSRTSDGDGVALILVKKYGKDIMNLYAGEDDREAKIDENAKIEFIEVWDGNYRTADGIRPTMSVKAAERILGKIERVFMSEIEAREFLEFKRKPRGLAFRADVDGSGRYGTAGIYPDNSRESKRYAPTAFILSVQVSGN